MQKLVVVAFQIETPHRHDLANFPSRRHTFVPVNEDHEPDSGGDF